MEQELKQLEEYVLVSPESVVSKTIKGTDSYYYYKYIGILSQEGITLTDDMRKELKSYSKFNTERAQDIKIRHLFKQYDEQREANNRDRVKEILQEINEQLLGYTFDIDQPANIQSENFNIQSVATVSTLDESVIDQNTIIERAYTHFDTFRACEHNFIRQLDLQRLKSSPQEIRNYFLNHRYDVFPLFPNIVDFLKFQYQEELEKNKQYQILSVIYKVLTLPQLEQLGEEIQDLKLSQIFISELFNKKFAQEQALLKDEKISYDQKIQILEAQYEWASKLAPKFQSLKHQIFYNIVQSNVNSESHDLALFLRFLNEWPQPYGYINIAKREEIQSKAYQHMDWSQREYSERVSDTQIIDKFLDKYFQENDDYTIFEPYLQKDYLVQKVTESRLHQGKEVQGLTNIFDANKIKELNDKKLITILSSNPKSFEHGKPALLKVQLKNIPTMTVKVFEIFTENYLTKYKQHVDNSINLEGLIASEQTQYTYEHPPVVKFNQEFLFENITKKERGVYIIEFTGNGLTSRAIISKGRLLLKQKETVAGHVFTLHDEQLQILNGQRTGLWVDEAFYRANPKGEILVPFRQNQTNATAVLVHEDFADLAQIVIKGEQYNFQCGYLYHPEQLLMGSKAKLLIQPSFQLNNNPVSFKLLSEPQVTVVTTNELDVPSTTVFDKIELAEDNDIEIEFPVPAKLRNISINVTVKVEPMYQVSTADGKKKNKLTLESKHTINFENYQGKRVFCSQYLRLSKEKGYEIYVLGKNGEKKSGVGLKLVLNLQGFQEERKTQLTTDDEGKVSLGHLQNVASIYSSIVQKGDIHGDSLLWNLKNQVQNTWPTTFELFEGETLELPTHNLSQNKEDYLLFSKANPQYFDLIQSYTDQLIVENSKVSFKDIPAGYYVLIYKTQNLRVDIQVHSQQLRKSDYLSRNGASYHKLKNNVHSLLLEQVQLDEQNQLKLQFKVSNPKNCRVHVFSSTFLQYGNIDDLAKQSIDRVVEKQNESGLSGSSPQAVYLNNKVLSDEMKYVADRKNQERYVGNTLEKPSFLLKRQYIRDTETVDEQLNQGGDFESQQEEHYYQQHRMMSKGMAKKMNMTSACSYLASVPSLLQRYDYVNSSLNFLQNPAEVQSNLKLNENGELQVLINKSHQTVYVLAINETHVFYEVIPLNTLPIQTRDLTQKQNDQSGKVFTIMRNEQVPLPGEALVFQDITSTDIQIVDSQVKLFSLLKEIRLCYGQDDEQEGGFDYWEFLKRWNDLDFDQKHNLFDTHQCDELNLFIYFKDRAYFETYVKDYISNKIEKTFVDHFLAQSRPAMINYAKSSQFQELNALEQSLLVIFMSELSVEPSDKEIAKHLYRHMEQKNKLAPVDQKNFQKLFDTILDAKTAGEPEGTKGAILQLQKQRGEPMIYACQMACDDDYLEEEYAECGGGECEMLEDEMFEELKVSKKKKRAVQRKRVLKKQEQESEEEEDCFDDDGDDFGYYVDERKKVRQDFQNLEKTKEYGEKHYAKTIDPSESKDLVSLNGFWIDVARHSIEHGIMQKAFVSPKFLYCNRNHTEMILTMALLDVPQNPPSHKYTPQGGKGVKIELTSPAIVFTKEIKEGKADLKAHILVSQRFFDPNDRYLFDDDDPNVTTEKEITEYLINKVYGCQVIITNCSVSKQDFQLLVEVPSGSIPVESIEYTKYHNITLEAYSTTTQEFFFYFPQVGTFTNQPANVSRYGTIVAVAQEHKFVVQERFVKENLETMNDILSKGDKEDILKFVQTKNIQNPNVFNFQDILYLLKDHDFYQRFIEILRERRIFNEDTWSFSIYHADHEGLKELLNRPQSAHTFSQFKYIKNSLIEHTGLRFTEYYPLVSQRVHQISKDTSNILNIQFKEKYLEFIQYLVQKHRHGLHDKLIFIYYLLLQERINEAIDIYKSIDQQSLPKKGDPLLQFDYFTAYLDFYIGFPHFEKAREVCDRYLDCPAVHWRNLFYEILNQLSEYDGEDAQEQKKRAQQSEGIQKQKSQLENAKVLQMRLEKSSVILTHQNIEDVTVSFYKIDLEVLFSRNPFISQENEDFAFVQPNLVIREKLGPREKTVIDIPEELKTSNLFIQVNGGDKKTQATYFSTSLKVSVLENSGQVKVQDQNEKFLSKVYVKTFAKLADGKVIFYKDGYTDLRGRLDYATLDAGSIKNVQKFAIFVISDELGSMITEAKPPNQIGKYEVEVKLVSHAWEQKRQINREQQVQSYAKNQSKYDRKK